MRRRGGPARCGSPRRRRRRTPAGARRARPAGRGTSAITLSDPAASARPARRSAPTATRRDRSRAGRGRAGDRPAGWAGRAARRARRRRRGRACRCGRVARWWSRPPSAITRRDRRRVLGGTSLGSQCRRDRRAGEQRVVDDDQVTATCAALQLRGEVGDAGRVRVGAGVARAAAPVSVGSPPPTSTTVPVLAPRRRSW